MRIQSGSTPSTTSLSLLTPTSAQPSCSSGDWCPCSMSYRAGAWSVGNVIRTRAERLLLWIQGRQPQHYGPKARIPELFRRRDQAWLAVQAGKLRILEPEPAVYHDLLDAAARVGVLEERLGYTFKNRMTCIEALKVTKSEVPLYYGGLIRHTNQNNRLALLGDRALTLAVCELWFQTEHSTSMSMAPSLDSWH